MPNIVLLQNSIISFSMPTPYSPSMASLIQFLFVHINPFWLHLSYFISTSFIGFLALKMTHSRSSASSKPGHLDMFFTSVSASTVSSMSVVEMEVFSTSQLVIMTILMFSGGEVFISMITLLLRRQPKPIDQLQLSISCSPSKDMRYQAIRTLSHILLGYLVAIHLLGSSLVLLYITLTPSAKNTLKTKNLNPQAFSIFLIVSTFTNCGFVPTNENMIVFRKNPGLLFIVFPHILLGNTLFPCVLRIVIWLLGKIHKREEYTYMLTHYKKLGFSHLLSTFNSWMLAATALGFVALQFVLFYFMEWSSEGLRGLSSYEKLVASSFQAANARHSGESIVDLSTVSTAIVVLFVVMMYLPPYTTFIPTLKNQQKELTVEDKEGQSARRKSQRKSKVLECMNMIFSPLFTLFIFTFLICISERDGLRDDPLNFNILSIVVEVVSSYGNVGYSMGYSCNRRLKLDDSCTDMWYGFSGRWSKEGKLVLIMVMFYGRLKKFNLQGGQGWHLK